VFINVQAHQQQVPIIKPTQENKYNTKTMQTHKDGSINKQNRKQQIE
jgi:hypothetical protein